MIHLDKTKLIFIVGMIILAGALAIYPNLSLYKQDDIITKIDSLNANRTQQFVRLSELQLVNQNITLENQQLIKANQELIKNVTGTNLNLTKHNKAVLDETNRLTKFLSDNFGSESGYIEKENLQYNQTNQTFHILKNMIDEIKAHEQAEINSRHLNITHLR